MASLILIFIELKRLCLQVRMVSVGDGGFPVHYGCMLKFDDGCRVLADNCSINCSVENVVLLITKDDTSTGMWNSFSAGASIDTLTVSCCRHSLYILIDCSSFFCN